jgi:hypothetical protein
MRTAAPPVADCLPLSPLSFPSPPRPRTSGTTNRKPFWELPPTLWRAITRETPSLVLALAGAVPRRTNVPLGWIRTRSSRSRTKSCAVRLHAPQPDALEEGRGGVFTRRALCDGPRTRPRFGSHSPQRTTFEASGHGDWGRAGRSKRCGTGRETAAFACRGMPSSMDPGGRVVEQRCLTT